jgi:hypothetical protein
MAIINNQMLFEFIEQANGNVSEADITIQFEGVPRSEIYKCINALKEAGWIVETRRFTWDISEKAIAHSKEVVEGERQEQIQNKAKYSRAKVDLKHAKEMLQRYPAIKLMSTVVLFISIGLSVLIVRKWINE